VYLISVVGLVTAKQSTLAVPSISKSKTNKRTYYSIFRTMSEWAYQGQCTPLRIRRIVSLHFGLGCEIEDTSISESDGSDQDGWRLTAHIRLVRSLRILLHFVHLGSTKCFVTRGPLAIG
jgi:hypothetical protein